jgi:hypothetical protein
MNHTRVPTTLLCTVEKTDCFGLHKYLQLNPSINTVEKLTSPSQNIDVNRG